MQAGTPKHITKRTINKLGYSSSFLRPTTWCAYTCTYALLIVFSSHFFWTSGLWTNQPGSHRRKITQNFSSIFLPWCLLYFFSREGFSRSFPSSTVKSNLCTKNLIVVHLLGIFFFMWGKIPVTGIRTHVPTSQKVSRLPTTERTGRPFWHKNKIII